MFCACCHKVVENSEFEGLVRDLNAWDLCLLYLMLTDGVGQNSQVLSITGTLWICVFFT